MFRRLWKNVVHRNRVERELDAELRAVFDILETEKRESGLTAQDARRAATIELGRIESIKEEVRHVRPGAWWDAFVQDFRHGIRLLIRTPVFSIFAISSLAFGIGATGAIFALFDSIVLRPLPVSDPDRLVVASFGLPGTNFNYSLPYPQFERMRDRSVSLDGAFATSLIGRVNVSAGGTPDIADGMFVSGDYYRTLGLSPAVGRLLDVTDDRPGQAVAVLSHAYWQRRFGGRTDVIGSAITVNQTPFTVVGVEPRGFFGTEVGRTYDVAVPLRARDLLAEGKPFWTAPFTTWIYVMGRLEPGVTIAAAEQELNVLFRQAGEDHARNPNEARRVQESRLRLEPGRSGAASELRNDYGRWLKMVLGLLAAVVTLASLNIATLLLSRADARQREISTRLAVGANRWRVVRQFLTESLVVASIAGAAGFALAISGSRALLRIAVPSAERLPIDLTPNLHLALFTAGLSLATCLLFGLLPAIRATSPHLFQLTRQIGGRRRRLLDRGLVGTQVALSLVLLVIAGLFVRSLGSLRAIDPGYDRRDVLMFSVDARLAGKRGPEVIDTYRRLIDEIRTVPGASMATLSAVRPVSDSYYFIDSVKQVGETRFTDRPGIRIAFNPVAPGYFSTLGIPITAGRDFDDRDSGDTPKVVVISERMARHFTGNPIGQRLAMSGQAVYEVVGVVRDTRYARIKDQPREVVYLPIFQAQPGAIFYSPTIEIRCAAPHADVLEHVRQAVARVDPGLTMFRVRTLEGQTEDSLSRERLLALISVYFGLFAVLLACIGLYGLMSYAVTQRTAEMGLRLALGAQPASVRWMIVGEAAVTVLFGAGLGLLASLASVRAVRGQLFGIEPYDPIAISGATCLLLAMALTAAFFPARRAARIDPLSALRHE